MTIDFKPINFYKHMYSIYNFYFSQIGQGLDPEMAVSLALDSLWDLSEKDHIRNFVLLLGYFKINISQGHTISQNLRLKYSELKILISVQLSDYKLDEEEYVILQEFIEDCDFRFKI